MEDFKKDEEFQRLLEVKAKRQGNLSQVQATLEQDADKVYASFALKIGDTDYPVKFRRFTHEQANMFVFLPFYDKLLNKAELTDEEIRQVVMVKAEMVRGALIDKKMWEPYMGRPEVVIPLYEAIALQSGMTESFDKSLMEYFNDDRGFSYGEFWLHWMGKTPSEIANLPETDVKAANVWVGRWAERMRAAKK